MNKTRSTRYRVIVLAGLLLLLAAGLVLAGGGVSQPRGLTAGGGAQVSSGSLTLSAALGQPVAGSVGTGELIAASGFWVGAGIQAQPPPTTDVYIYLPVVTR